MRWALVRSDVPGLIHFWTISCYQRLPFFTRDCMREVVVSGLRQLQLRHEVCLIAYVVMPEHVHVVLLPHGRGRADPMPIETLFATFKRHVGYYGKQVLREVWRQEHRLWTSSLNGWAHDERGSRSLWTTRGYDFNVTQQAKLCEKIDYCHKNPVTRRMVERAEEWKWSSYRFYEFGDESVLRMDWDGRWPIEW